MQAELFTSAHAKQLAQLGFVRVEAVIPAQLWYLLPDTDPGIIPSHHHQAQWDIRQHPPLHQVFSELWQTR